LDTLAEGEPAEIVVVDGGSSDDTRAIARKLGARDVTAARGRGPQLAAGADAAGGGWLLFLHADTRLGSGWWRDAREFMSNHENLRKAGVFRLRLDSERPEARRIEKLAAWRGRRFGVVFGDQGLLISRPFYRELGGFPPIPLMEDFHLARRIGRKNLHFFETPAVTSATRYQSGGWFWRASRNLALQAMFLAGVPPRILARLY
jgi:rSAM/selenodomain-associated transferase 2